MTEDVPKFPITQAVAAVFLANLDLLGMPSTGFGFDMDSREFIIQFEHPFFVIRLLETIITRIDKNFYCYLNKSEMSITEKFFPTVRKGVAKLAKRNMGMKEVDPMESEISFSLNKVAHVLINEMDAALDFKHPALQQFKSAISPENYEKITVLVALLPNLCPRELGGIRLSFKNTDHVIGFDFPDR